MFGWFRRKKRPEKQVVHDESKLPPRPPVKKATQVKPQQKHLLRGPGSLRDQDISTHAPWYYTGLYGGTDATSDQNDADGSDAVSDAGSSSDVGSGSDSGWSGGSDSGGGFDGGGFDSSSF